MTIEAPPSGGPIERYFAIMETVVAAGQGINLTEVASITRLPKPTAHRLLNSLVEIGALELSDNRTKLFLPGPRLWRMLQLGANPSQMARFPDWRPIPPGPENPLGTHALYLSWPAYLIHGTHDTRKIGRLSSNGCYGLYNEHVTELYDLAEIGTQVAVF